MSLKRPEKPRTCPGSITKTPTQFKTNVGNCARCGGNHDVLLFRKLRRPVVAPDREWTHWASCPENGEPILLRRELAAKDGA